MTGRAFVLLALATRLYSADLLLLPPVVSPGETIEVQVLDAARTPPAGKWTIAGVEASGESPLRIRLPDSLPLHSPVAVTYTNVSGEVLSQTANLWVAPPPAALDPAPRIT